MLFTNEERSQMLSDLVNEIDYDVWKELFHYNENDELVDRLHDIVAGYEETVWERLRIKRLDNE